MIGIGAVFGILMEIFIIGTSIASGNISKWAGSCMIIILIGILVLAGFVALLVLFIGF
ncbi:hypothetical protein [Terribacillus saccharophilus]|uniref:hypothetical protein n=1 Tax=Terribacillus saccharophilus TaxID=361277 RepID=UPI002DD1BAE6|nr:hypothetical protein [Terribacillus saccharophilus]